MVNENDLENLKKIEKIIEVFGFKNVTITIETWISGHSKINLSFTKSAFQTQKEGI